MKTTLFIDTSDSTITTIKIIRDTVEKMYQEKTDEHKSQNLLPLIEKALQTEKITLSDLTGIEVAVGTGSFTGIRVGVSVANTLAFVLGILVNGKKQVVPEYTPSKFDT